MTQLAYALRPDHEAARVVEYAESLKRPTVCNFNSIKQHLSASRPRKIPPWKITWAEILFAIGVNANQVRWTLRLGDDTVKDIKSGRMNGNGRIPADLESHQRYVEPQDCGAGVGHFVTVLPCRQCAALRSLARGKLTVERFGNRAVSCYARPRATINPR